MSGLVSDNSRITHTRAIRRFVHPINTECLLHAKPGVNDLEYMVIKQQLHAVAWLGRASMVSASAQK